MYFYYIFTIINRIFTKYITILYTLYLKSEMLVTMLLVLNYIKFENSLYNYMIVNKDIKCI